MKKLTTLLLAAGMVFAASAPASAVDVKMDGIYEFQFTQGAGVNFDSSKFDKHSVFRVASLDRIDYVVTDVPLPPAYPLPRQGVLLA